MNKRFTFKFIKYILLYFIISTILFIIGFIGFLYILSIGTQTELNDLDSSFLELQLKDTQDDKPAPSPNVKRMAKKENAEIYIVDKQGNYIYPNKTGNIKSKILNNIYHTNSIRYLSSPDNKYVYLIYIFKNEEKIHIKNKNSINTQQLIQSTENEGLNKYHFNIENNHLNFIKNTTQRKYLDDSIGNATNINLWLWVLVIIISNLLISIIISIILSKRLSNPLIFHINWVENLAKGKLYKPESKYNHKKIQKTYKELNTSITALNNQLLEDKFYQERIQYYKRKWISQISHDLKSPLTSIYGYSKLLSSNTCEENKYLILISNKAEYMNTLIDKLNSDFNMETQQMEIQKERFNLYQTIMKINKTLGYEKINISFKMPKDISFYGNKLYFERLLINLISNSIEHNKQNPNIDIFFSQDNNDLKINYFDDGHGLGNKKLSDLINTNYTTKMNIQNSGLGFSIIYDSVKFHDGTIIINSPAKGASFTIWLKQNT
ncbi:sensor histidine kinase [Staphylococcus caeli]|uniref:sensor histidine kinase n=1 Tax=Staphylococcus caeli TaxID=2201815 RepID=UPI003F550362